MVDLWMNKFPLPPRSEAAPAHQKQLSKADEPLQEAQTQKKKTLHISFIACMHSLCV